MYIRLPRSLDEHIWSRRRFSGGRLPACEIFWGAIWGVAQVTRCALCCGFTTPYNIVRINGWIANFLKVPQRAMDTINMTLNRRANGTTEHIECFHPIERVFKVDSSSRARQGTFGEIHAIPTVTCSARVRILSWMLPGPLIYEMAILDGGSCSIREWSYQLPKLSRWCPSQRRCSHRLSTQANPGFHWNGWFVWHLYMSQRIWSIMSYGPRYPPLGRGDDEMLCRQVWNM